MKDDNDKDDNERWQWKMTMKGDNERWQWNMTMKDDNERWQWTMTMKEETKTWNMKVDSIKYDCELFTTNKCQWRDIIPLP